MKSRTNVSIDSGLLDAARALEINLSAALEARLRELVAEKRQQEWLIENRQAIAEANAFVDRHGLWSDGRRQF